MHNDSELVLLIGRIEGKVDTLVHMQGATSQRIDAIEQRTATVEQKIVALSTTGATSKTWLSTLISIASFAVSALAVYFGTKT